MSNKNRKKKQSKNKEQMTELKENTTPKAVDTSKQKTELEGSSESKSRAQINDEKGLKKWLRDHPYQFIITTIISIGMLITGAIDVKNNLETNKPVGQAILPLKVQYIPSYRFSEINANNNIITIDEKEYAVYRSQNEIIDIMLKTTLSNNYIGVYVIELSETKGDVEGKSVKDLKILYSVSEHEEYKLTGLSTPNMILNDSLNLPSEERYFNIKLLKYSERPLIIPFCITRELSETEENQLTNHDFWNNCDKIVLKYNLKTLTYKSEDSNKEQSLAFEPMKSVNLIQGQ